MEGLYNPQSRKLPTGERREMAKEQPMANVSGENSQGRFKLLDGNLEGLEDHQTRGHASATATLG